MEQFIYKHRLDMTALSASFNEFSYKKHSHEEYALGVTLRGIQAYDLDGCSQISHANGVMLFNPEQVHDGRAGRYQDGLEYLMLYIKPELLLEAIGEKSPILFHTPVIYDERLKHSILNLTRAILVDTDEALCHELFLNMTDCLINKEFIEYHKHEDKLIVKAKEMIHEELETVLNLDALSQEFNLSKFQLIRIFKSNTGITPYQYFLNSKIAHAKKHLDINKDLYAAVVEFGFTDLSHLNRHFKRVYGVTAYEYLAQNLTHCQV